MHDCFIRELKEGARPIDRRPDVLVSPCDAIVGACGTIAGTELYQAKGFPYTLEDLLGDRDLVEAHRNGRYVTLRLTSSMYHRFHAPHDGRIDKVIYISGDTWNVNPIALKRIERLFCKNERAVMPVTLVGRRRTCDPGSSGRHPGREHSAKFSGCVAQSPASRATTSSPATRHSAKATNWAGSSMARPSSSLPLTLSRCAITCAKARASASANR